MLEPFTPSFFRRLQQLKIHTRRAFLGSRQGSHISPRRGHGLEFSDFRAYVPGDDFRYIDWGVYGRTDRFYVRQFREEQDVNVVVLLDTSNSMAYPAGGGKFDLARQLALALGYIALTDGDTVTFSLLGQENSPKFRSPHSLHRAAKLLEQSKPGNSFHLATEVRAAVARQKIPGRCFFISDFLVEREEQFAAIDVLRARNFEVSVLHVLAPSELRLEMLGSQLVVDAESGSALDLALSSASQKEYAAELADHVQALERYCVQAAIAHILVSSKEHISDIVLTRLPQVGILK